jgi:hypothetical protein
MASSSASANLQEDVAIGKTRPNKYTIISCIIASSGALLFGLDVGVSLYHSCVCVLCLLTAEIEYDMSLTLVPNTIVVYPISQITGGVLASKLPISLIATVGCMVKICDMYCYN